MGRFVLKVSGEALGGSRGFGTDPDTMTALATSVLKVHEAGHEIAVMVGGGNYFRGGDATGWTIPRAERDNVGILGTIMNGIFLRGALAGQGFEETRLMTAVPVTSMAESYVRLRADRHLSKHRVVILAGGNGQPFVTTDYPAVQRAIELDAAKLLVAKSGSPGVMTNDPRLGNDAQFITSISHDEVIRRGLRIMDQSAFVLASEHHLPIRVFGVDRLANLVAICAGAPIGTLVETGAEFNTVDVPPPPDGR